MDTKSLTEALARTERQLQAVEAQRNAFLAVLPDPAFRVNREGLCLEAYIPAGWPVPRGGT